MIIIYLHGFRSTGSNGKTAILKEMFPEYRVIGCQFSPHKPSLASKELSELMVSLKGESEALDGLCVIGTSLGGFWSRWLSFKFGIKSLIVHPSLHPDKTIPVGTFSVFDDSDRSIQVSSEDQKEFVDFKVPSDQANGLDCHVWVNLDDELLDAQSIVTELNNLHKVTTFDSGGHRFLQFIKMRDDIDRFINNCVE